MNTERRDAEINLNDGQTSVTTVTTAVPWDAGLLPPLTGEALARSVWVEGMNKTKYKAALREAGFTTTEAQYWADTLYIALKTGA